MKRETAASAVEAWLEALGLAHLAPAFAEHRIELELLPGLSDAHLKELGVTAIGDRLRLRRGIEALAAGPGERRQVTVLAADLGGLPPAAARPPLEAAGGHLGEAEPGRLLAFFGWPQAREDAAERAVRAGLALLAQAAGRGRPRLAVTTGEVLLDVAGTAPGGSTPALALALLAAAAPDNLVAADSTRALAGPEFVYRALPGPLPGGVPGPLWQVVGRQALVNRFRAEKGASLTPLVGRLRELGWLVERWRQARAGAGQVVLLGGEPGIGKSRLLEALTERLAADRPTIFRYQYVAALANTALHAMAAQVERVSRFAPGDSAERKLEKLRAAMVPEVLSADDLAGLADMLALPLAETAALTPEQRKRRTFAAIIRQLVAVAERGPVLLLLEDAQWADPTGMELVGEIVPLIAARPVMMLVTHRPGWTPAWVGQPHVSAIQLGMLAAAEAEQMLGALVGGRLPPAVMRRILARGEGIPLYLEELAKAVLERAGAAAEADGPAVPATLQDSLQARIDMLGRAKAAAQAAAAIGREWPVALLSAVLEIQPAALRPGLEALQSAGLAYPVAEAETPTWTFKHALVREAAYASLPPAQRPTLHARIAAILRARFPAIAAQRPELLAQHDTEARDWPQAVATWRAAAARAAASHGHAEAMSNARRGLELLHRLDDPAAREAAELDLRLLLGLGYQALKGFADPAVETELGRAWTLAAGAGTDAQRNEILGGLFSYYFIRGDLHRARAQAEAGIALARRAGQLDRLASARAELGNVMFWQGDFLGAVAELDDCLEIVARLDAFSPTRGQWDPRVNGQAYRSWTVWTLGYPVQALAAAATAEATARELRQPFALSLALLWSIYTHLACGLPDQAEARADELRQVAEAHRFAFWTARCRTVEAQLRLLRGEPGEAAALFDEAMALTRATGAPVDRPRQLALAAELALAQGRPERALGQVEEAFAAAHRKQEYHWFAELHRLRARLRRETGDTAAARAELAQALAVARRQQARMLELRAATDLARLLAAEGEAPAARDLLAPLLAWFAEDGGDRNLATARILLAELS